MSDVTVSAEAIQEPVKLAEDLLDEQLVDQARGGRAAAAAEKGSLNARREAAEIDMDQHMDLGLAA